MSAYTWNDYIVMRYIGFGSGKSHPSTEDAKGFLDYYFRVELTPEAFDESIAHLLEGGMIRRDGTSVKPTEKAKAMQRQCRTFRDFFGWRPTWEQKFEDAFRAMEWDLPSR